jgi:predicted amidohydrolase
MAGIMSKLAGGVNPASPPALPLIDLDPATGLAYANNNHNFIRFSAQNSRGRMKTRLSIEEDGKQYQAELDNLDQLSQSGTLDVMQKDRYSVLVDLLKKTKTFIAMMVRWSALCLPMCSR